MENYINKVLDIDYLELLKKIPDNSVDLCITDPPYGIDYQNNYTSKIHNKIANDNNDFSYLDLAKQLFRILKNDTAIFIFTIWSTYSKHFEEIKLAGFKMKEPLIIQKKASGTHDLYGSFQSNSDWIIFAHKGRFKFKKTNLLKNKKAGIIPAKGRKPIPEYKTRFPSCWFGDQYPYSSENSAYQSKNNIYHPTIKGLKFTEWLIQLSTNKDDIVIDPFLGTGTTAIAAQKTNRKFIGTEIDENYRKYCQIRLNKLI